MHKRFKVITFHPVLQLFKDYRLPMIATTVFAIVVLLMLLFRYQAATTISEVLSNSTANSNYGSLLSNDGIEGLNSPGRAEENATTPTTNAASNEREESFTVSSGNNPTSSPSPPPPPPPGTDPTPPPPPPPPPPFDAKVKQLNLVNSSQSCAGPIGFGSCSRRYEFKGAVETYNGPGLVKYGWDSNFPEANSDGEFNAGPGQGLTTLNKVINIPCGHTSRIVLRLRIDEPNQHSKSIEFDHSCSGTSL